MLIMKNIETKINKVRTANISYLVSSATMVFVVPLQNIPFFKSLQSVAFLFFWSGKLIWFDDKVELNFR